MNKLYGVSKGELLATFEFNNIVKTMKIPHQYEARLRRNKFYTTYNKYDPTES